MSCDSAPQIVIVADKADTWRLAIQPCGTGQRPSGVVELHDEARFSESVAVVEPLPGNPGTSREWAGTGRL
jgi:hypothetical protein